MTTGRGKRLGAFLQSLYHIEDVNTSGHCSWPQVSSQRSTSRACNEAQKCPSICPWAQMSQDPACSWSHSGGDRSGRNWPLDTPQSAQLWRLLCGSGSLRTPVLPGFPSCSRNQHLIPCGPPGKAQWGANTSRNPPQKMVSIRGTLMPDSSQLAGIWWNTTLNQRALLCFGD